MSATLNRPVLVAPIMVRLMEMDNGCSFFPSQAQMERLEAALWLMQQNGACFEDSERRELFVQGEASEMEDAFKNIEGFEIANKTLNDIFERADETLEVLVKGILEDTDG